MRDNWMCIVVSVSVLVSNVPRVLAQQRGGQLYHVNVIEWTQVVGYGDDINNEGQAAVTRWENESVARRWDARNGFLSLGGANTRSTGINNLGDVTVVHDAPGGRLRSFLWTEADNTLSDIGGLSAGHTFADAVNDHGHVVGWSDDLGGNDRAFRWTKESGMRSLDAVRGSEGSSMAHDITNSGVIVGRSYGSFGQSAFRWTETEGMQNLGGPSGGIAESVAFAANEQGQVVGSARNQDGRLRAVLWANDVSIYDLGALRPGDHSTALDINNSGDVVGWSVQGSGGPAIAYVPFIWTQREGMIDLHALLDDESRGWRLSGDSMGGINDRSEILLLGSLDGQFARIVLTPIPEPAVLANGFGILLLLKRRARQGTIPVALSRPAGGRLAIDARHGHRMPS